MNKMIGRIAATVALVSVVAGGAIGQSKPKAPACPVCHMPLTTKKTKTNTVAVKGPGGKTLYCCSKCDMKKKK